MNTAQRLGILLLCGTVSTSCSKQEVAPGGGGGGFSMPPTAVEVATAERGELVDRFETVGSFAAVSSVAVVAEVNGIVRQLPFEEGEPVKKGALLARLEDDELLASVDRAKAVLEQNRNSFERIQRIVDQKAGTPQDLDDARSAVKVAEAELALSRARLEKTRIRAPFAGHVGSRLVDAGAFVQPGQAITQLTQLDELKVVCTAPERYLPRLRVGAKITVSTPAYPGVEVEGEIRVVDPVVDPETRTIEIVGRVPNPNLRFRPGMSADVVAVLQRKSDALTIPSAAVFAQGAQMLVFVVASDSTVQQTPVTLGTRLAARVEVLEGLEEGDRVVQAGHQKLFPGARVMPIQVGSSPGAEVP